MFVSSDSAGRGFLCVQPDAIQREVRFLRPAEARPRIRSQQGFAHAFRGLSGVLLRRVRPQAENATSDVAETPQVAACLTATKVEASTDRMPDDSLENAVFLAARDRLAQRMRALRDVAEMPQQVAADRAGIDRTTWNRIERARLPGIRLETLLRIQYALGLDTLEGLFGETTGDLFATTAAAPREDRSG